MSVAARVASVRARIARSAARSGRHPEDVLLVAVSKTFPVDAIREAVEAGVTDLGENRAQELQQKAGLLEGVRWHFVGHLQSNKVRHVVGVASLVHSVDGARVAQAIGKRARALQTTQDVLIEVNVSGEASKQGVEPEHLRALVEEVEAIEGVALRGLMTMPPLPESPESSRPYLRRLAELREQLEDVAPEAGELSMGMTRDLEVAVEEGATIVRVGEAIFGPRPPRA